jgi:hypothetical protein
MSGRAGALAGRGHGDRVRDWLCRWTRHRGEPAEVVKCSRRAIWGELKGLTAVNLVRAEEFEMAGIKLNRQERFAIE